MNPLENLVECAKVMVQIFEAVNHFELDITTEYFGRNNSNGSALVKAVYKYPDLNETVILILCRTQEKSVASSLDELAKHMRTINCKLGYVHTVDCCRKYTYPWLIKPRGLPSLVKRNTAPNDITAWMM